MEINQKALKELAKPKQEPVCPCCGYCPHCGRSSQRTFPWVQQPNFPSITYIDSQPPLTYTDGPNTITLEFEGST